MKENNILKEILLGISKFHDSCRLFRNNVGTGWTGRIKSSAGGGVYIENPRPLNAGLVKGSSDLIGWTTVKITEDMVGKPVAIFTAVEVKTPTGKVQSSQLNFINQVNKAGGIAGVCRSEQQAIELINKSIKNLNEPK